MDSPSVLDLLPQLASAAPHTHALALEFVGVETDVVTLKAPFREDLVGDPELNVLAGGVALATTLSSKSRQAFNNSSNAYGTEVTAFGRRNTNRLGSASRELMGMSVFFGSSLLAWSSKKACSNKCCGGKLTTR